MTFKLLILNQDFFKRRKDIGFVKGNNGLGKIQNSLKTK